MRKHVAMGKIKFQKFIEISRVQIFLYLLLCAQRADEFPRTEMQIDIKKYAC